MIHRKWFVFGTLILAVGVWVGGLHQPTRAQSVAQGYSADTQLQIGLIVKLKDNDPSKVEPDTAATITKMYGAVISPTAVPVTLSGPTAGPQVYVVTSGTYDVLVSNQAGSISSGDYITISSLDGVGMKTDDSHVVVVGKAASSFDGKANVINTTTLKDSNNNKLNVSIGRIPVAISVGRNPLLKTSQSNLPGFLQRATSSVANKTVSAPRVYISFVILIATSLVAGIMMYGGIRSSIVAVGRNPLSKKSIMRGLLQVTLTSLMIFIFGLFGVYLLLKL